MFRIALLIFIFIGSRAPASDWPQGPGSDFDFTTPDSQAPSLWSVTRDQNIAWRTKLPETGQSTPVIVGDRIFVTTMLPVDADSTTGADIVAWCFSAKDGALRWKRNIPGAYQTRLSAPFGDASSPAAVTDGTHVWFLNPTGQLACFDLEGNPRWNKSITSVARTRPVFYEGKLILHHQVYLPNEAGSFTHENAHASHDKWTQLQAIDAETGERVWLSECGANMGCVPLVQKLSDGTAVLVVGRGGGHGPPETPEGVSMIRADTGETVWTLELPEFMSTQTYPIVDGHALVFHKGDHLWVDVERGEVSRDVSILKEIAVRRWTPNGRETRVETLKENKPRSITQQSNLRVGDHHYFLCYTQNYLGRVDVVTGKVEYLELPLQVLREPGRADQYLWSASPASQSSNKLEQKLLKPNLVKNSRGFLVMGDVRATGNGWGHVCAPIPTAFGNRLFVPLMSGTVFVIQADADVLDENAVLSINDLGSLGDAYTRASLTTDGTRIYAHTIQELIAIEKQ